MLVLTNMAYGQSDSVRKSALIQIPTDTLTVDTALVKKDTTSVPDSIAKRNALDTLGIRISPDALTSVVTAEATDSAVLNMRDNVFELYGDAKVKYEDAELDAHQVTYHQASNVVTASLSEDTTIANKGKPLFTQGKEKFTYDSLQYNFKSKRAIVRNAHSQYGEGFVHSTQVKRNPDQSIYGAQSVYTTCALEHPHFGINARKIKVVPGRVIASGPANINIEGVPTPIFLPFGLFPVSQGQRSGFKIPTYTVEEERGMGLVNGGYYFALGEKMDFLAEGSFYSKGSWGSSLTSYYANRYHYAGNVNFRYNYFKRGESYESTSSVQKDFKLIWAHRSDPKSRPGVSFNASVDAGTNTYNANNAYNVNQILQNTAVSSITYSKQWQNKPYSLTIGITGSQHTQPRSVSVTLPNISFSSPINPFHSKNSTTSHWYNKITIPYVFTLQNVTTFNDSGFNLNQLSLTDFNNAATHSLPISATYTIARFVNVTGHVNYKEYWLTKRMYQLYNRNTDKIDTSIYRGFYTARDFDAGVDFNTRIYGTKLFKKGKLAGIRHMLTPSTGFNYTPDFAADPFNYGYYSISDKSGVPRYNSVYEGSILGTPGQNQFGKPRSAVAFALANNLQIKVRTPNDSTGFKNIRLIDNFSINTFYNITADSFNWAPLSISFATLLFNAINVNAGANYDLYAFDYTTGRRLRQTKWDYNGGIARFQSAAVSISGNINPKKNAPTGNPANDYRTLMQYGIYNDYVDFNIPFNCGFTYSFNINKQYSSATKSDTVVVTQHSIRFNADLNLTPRWKIVVNSGFDIAARQLQATQFEVVRDLHCWEMRISTIPFGTRKNYMFTLQVKASVLQDLKITKRKDYRDSAY